MHNPSMSSLSATQGHKTPVTYLLIAVNAMKFLTWDIFLCSATPTQINHNQQIKNMLYPSGAQHQHY